MTYDEVKHEVKAEQYWLLRWSGEYIIGYVNFNKMDGLAVYFPGISGPFEPQIIPEFIRKIDVPERNKE